MIFLKLRDSLVRLLSWIKHRDESSNSVFAKSEQSRLIHRLNCIHLNDEEAKCLQAYLTLILEERYQGKTSDRGGIVLEMGDEEYQDFAYHIGSNGIRLLRVLVDSANSRTEERKLAIFSDNGLRLFRVQVQNGNTLLQKSAPIEVTDDVECI